MKNILFALCFLPLLSNAQIITTIAGNGTAGYSGDGGLATAAMLNAPNGVVFDCLGNLYISEYENHTIRKVSPGGIITTIAGNGTPGYGGDGGPATSAQLDGPVKIAMDRSGNLFIADKYNNRIRKITSSGIISTVAGTGTPGYSGDGGAATVAELNGPIGIAVDDSGNIYIGDYSNYVVRKVSSVGIITTIAGNGTAGDIGDGGPATVAEIFGAYGVNVDDSGNIYIADPVGNKIRKVNAITGIITTFAGTGVAGYSGDGVLATATELNNVAGVAFDSFGNVYIDDMFNGRIREVAPSGIITTIVGNGITGYSGDGGPATSAEIYWSTDITFDLFGNLVLSDNNNNRVRSVSGVASGIKAPLANAFSVYPNPTFDNITIEIPNYTIAGNVQLLNELGQVVEMQNIYSYSTVISLSQLPTGIYIARINYNNDILYTKILKE